jgi:hypothetical protein
MTPYGWGHSQLLGRARYHLAWTIKKLNVRGGHEIAEFLRKQSSFPGVHAIWKNDKMLEKIVSKEDKSLGAYEVASIMIMMPFVLACCRSTLVTSQIKEAWCLENVFGVDYYRFAFSEAQIEQHNRAWERLKTLIQKVYVETSDLIKDDTANKLKFHDPTHDERIIRGYGNFRIINELPKERVHQIPKHTPHNNREVEDQMLIKVT